MRVTAEEIAAIERAAMEFPGVDGVNLRVQVLDDRPGRECEMIEALEYTGSADPVALAAFLEGSNCGWRGTPTHVKPIPMRLPCPECRMLHVDPPDFMKRPHRTHRCNPEDGGCGHKWRPYEYPTVGVPFVDRAAPDEPGQTIAALLQNGCRLVGRPAEGTTGVAVERDASDHKPARYVMYGPAYLSPRFFYDAEEAAEAWLRETGQVTRP